MQAQVSWEKGKKPKWQKTGLENKGKELPWQKTDLKNEESLEETNNDDSKFDS